MSIDNLGWLDIHGHFFLPQSEDDLKKVFAQFRANCFLVSDDWRWSLTDTLAYMDAAGIQMQMLSYLPSTVSALKESNTFGAAQVRENPERFGLLCALPTENVDECLSEIERSQNELHADGFAVSSERKGVSLSDPSLDPVWKKLDSLGATVFSHPNAYAPARDGRPTPVIEVAFETCRVAVDMLYRGVFERFPHIKFVFAHSGGALPVLSGRLELLGSESWVPGSDSMTAEKIRKQLGSLYVDTAATASTGMEPAIKMVGVDHIVYGSDCGVPCSTRETMEANRKAVVEIGRKIGLMEDHFGRNGWALFPTAARRVEHARNN